MTTKGPGFQYLGDGVCHAKRTRRIDISGRKFGHLTVLKHAGSSKGGEALWQCRCDCGALTQVLSSDVRRSRTVSCGCVRAARLAGRHGEASRLYRTPEYRAWGAMLSRCTDANRKDFHRYGGRGICVCDRWRDFESFLADILSSIARRPSSRYSLDRIDNDGNYEPGNVRWATASQQRQNQRRSQ